MSLVVSRSRRLLKTHHLASRPRPRTTLAIWALCVVGFGSIALVIGVATVVALLAWFGRFAGALPSPEQLTQQTPFQTTRILASDGRTDLFDLTDPQGGNRTIVPLSDMPRALIEGVIATEDAGFYSNPGFEIRAILRASIDDLTRQHIVSGASTITQQVVRNILLSPSERLDMSARRKIKEIVLAYQLTQTYSKDEILSVYLNEIYFGNHSYGIEAAAEGYFGKPAADLDLAESAMLAGLPQAPSEYDPYIRLDEVKRRQETVLQRMVDQGYITPAQAQAAESETLHFVDRRHALVAPHFVNYVGDLLLSQLGPERLYHSGYHVVTTLDDSLQRQTESAIQSDLKPLQGTAGNNVAVVALDPRNGQILAMVGSANYEDSTIAGQVNMALAPQASAGILSPLTFALALEKGQTLNSRIDPNPSVNLALGSPVTVASAAGLPVASGPVTLRQALGLGLDQPANTLIGQVGNQSFINLVTRLGVTDFAKRVQYGQDLHVAGAQVSPLEVAEMYAMLANAGTAHRASAVQKILAANGNVVAQTSYPGSKLLDPGVAYLVTNVLSDPSVRPPLSKNLFDVGYPVAVHFRVSDNRRDAWVSGYTPNLVVVVWLGRVNGQPLEDPNVAAHIWSDVVKAALKERPVEKFAVPSDVTTMSLCQNPDCSIHQSEYIIRGTQATAEDANAAALGTAPPTISTGRTPLVNRFASASPATITAPAVVPSTDNVTVPDLSGSSLDQARARLAALGLTDAPLVTYLSRTQLSMTQQRVAVGRVVGTAPAAGEVVATKTSIVLSVRSN